jgi:hypothetical protein
MICKNTVLSILHVVVHWRFRISKIVGKTPEKFEFFMWIKVQVLFWYVTEVLSAVARYIKRNTQNYTSHMFRVWGANCFGAQHLY